MRSLADSARVNSSQVESRLEFKDRNYAWIRAEKAGRSNELVMGKRGLPPGLEEELLTRVQACAFAFDRDLKMIPQLRIAMGAQVTIYGVGTPPIYGSDPIAVRFFLRDARS